MHTPWTSGRLRSLASLAVICGTFSGTFYSDAAWAGPSDYVFTPTVEEGEREVDFKAGSSKLRDGGRANKESIGFGYGANAWWFTEVYAIWHKNPGERHGFDAWEWENKFQLLETGKYPVELGFVLELERPQNRAEGYEVKWGPLLQTDFGTALQANLNLLWQKSVRAVDAAPTSLAYQWQFKYRWRPELEYGVQGFGELGAWRHWSSWSEQSHQVGPAVFGRVRLAERQTIKYNAALLFGRGGAAPRNTLRVQAEYEF